MPSLPIELERLIFEMAALQDTDHDSRVQLALVAKRVYEWIRPILYRVVILAGPYSTPSWRNANITDIAQFVRHLLIIDRESDILELISTFRNLENLAIWRSFNISAKALKEIDNLPLRMLSADLKTLQAFKSCRAFKNLTHLEIFDISEGPAWNDCKALIELPKLTHLCFDLDGRDGVVQDLLKHCSSLRVMISLIIAPFSTSAMVVDDPRHVILEDHITVDDLAEWERSANGLIGCWELADIIIEARKCKLFRNSPFIFSRKTWMYHLNDNGMRWYKEWSRGHVVDFPKDGDVSGDA